MAINASESNPAARQPGDRRRTPTSLWSAFVPGGRRMRNRRTSEHQLPYFVDRFSASTLLVIILLLGLSIADGAITLILIQDGCEEINPVMWFCLSYGPMAFLLAKYVLTAAGLPILLIFKNFYLFHSGFRVGYLIPLFIFLYTLLIAYQFSLLHA